MGAAEVMEGIAPGWSMVERQIRESALSEAAYHAPLIKVSYRVSAEDLGDRTLHGLPLAGSF